MRRTKSTFTGKFCDWMAIFACCLPFLSGPASAERIKDLATVQGIRNNQLVGYGLVVGLDGSGDQTTQTPFTVQSVTNMLTSMGIQVPSFWPEALKATERSTRAFTAWHRLAM